MGIKYDEVKRYWIAQYSKRDPISRKPKTMTRKGLKSKVEALRVEKELVLLMDRSFKIETLPNWQSCVTQYVSDLGKRDISIKTVDTYRLCLEAHTMDIWGARLIDEITSQDIRNLIQQKVADRSPSHQKNVLKYIRGVFNFAVENRYISANPTPQMKFRIGDKLKTVLTKAQVNHFLTQAKILNSEWYPIWAMALYTGMRNGELFAVTWDKVDLERRTILVDSSWNNQDGFKDTKSGDDRIVQLAPELAHILKELKLKNNDSPFVLPRIDKWEKGEQARELRSFLLGVGLPRIRFHDLRATWATIMLNMGIAPIQVMIMGGWKDLKTMQYYVRKAGVDTTGISDKLSLHNPDTNCSILNFKE